jgi:hypothetical protein
MRYPVRSEFMTNTTRCLKHAFHHGILICMICMIGLNSAPECHAGSARVRNRTATHGGAQRRAGTDAPHRAVEGDMRFEYGNIIRNRSSSCSSNLSCNDFKEASSHCGGLMLRLLDLVSYSALGGVLLETPDAPRTHRSNT